MTEEEQAEIRERGREERRRAGYKYLDEEADFDDVDAALHAGRGKLIRRLQRLVDDEEPAMVRFALTKLLEQTDAAHPALRQGLARRAPILPQPPPDSIPAEDAPRQLPDLSKLPDALLAALEAGEEITVSLNRPIKTAASSSTPKKKQRRPPAAPMPPLDDEEPTS